MASTVNPAVAASIQKSERVTLTGSGPAIVQTWLVPSAQVTTFESENALGVAHAVYTTAQLQTRDKDHIDGEDGTTALYKYTLNFTRPTASGVLGVRPAGTEMRSGSANATDVPIQRNPNRANFTDTKDGIDSYVSPQPTYTHTEFVTSSAIAEEDGQLPESEIIDKVGRRASAATLAAYGLSISGDDGRWFMVDKRLEFRGDVWEVTRVWQYAENGWDSEIYPNEAGAYG